MKAFVYHSHGIGQYDFSSLVPEDLSGIQKLSQERDLEILPTAFLGREKQEEFLEVVRAFGEQSAKGLLPNVAGFAVEGPILGPHGGIPRSGKWIPSAEEWQKLSELGKHGLRYVVIAPDAMGLDEEIDDGLLFSDLILSFYENGIKIALGHFHHDNPRRSSELTLNVVEFLHGHYESSPYLVLTDHLYNDMPRNFSHAWRTPEEWGRRDRELSAVMEEEWVEDNVSRLLGPVPATLLNEARAKRLIPCLNFDGRHVDLEICRRTVDYLGPENLIALTDHTEVDVMAGEQLSRIGSQELWCRDDGAVAAGSQGYEQQRRNMIDIGLAEDEIRTVFSTNPRAAIAYRPSAVKTESIRL
ncbi:hypothetical protein [Nocardiopsis tropica]|uniref:Amidohydrolase-related domain-containing protein n=1 Tax=Nocardiopsis tropica TaxID=109330 RepID=A0ABV1ZRN7_9ACTN